MKGSRRQNKYDCVVNSPVGKLGVAFTDDRPVRIDFLPSRTSLFFSNNIVMRSVITKIKKYFYNPNTKFNLFPSVGGTLLQRKIWQALQKIPCGKTVTYGELAKKLKTGPRVIGNACRMNPLPIVIPCHRVVAATGLGGYCGKISRSIKIKKWLLQHESGK